ncbi:MAG: cupin domain-containing protein [Pseudomonadota bacterium]
MRRVGLVLAACFLSPSALAQGEEGKDFIVTPAAALEWQDAAQFPGLAFARLEGDPAKPGPYILLARFPPGVMTPPHSHDQDRFVTVIQGTWHVGVGPVLDRAAMTPLPPGSFMKHPKGAVHYDGSKEGEVIVQITGMGPVATAFANQRP